MNRLVACVGLMLTAVAWAQGAQRHLASAAQAVDAARAQARRAPRCQMTLGPQLDNLAARIAQQRGASRDEEMTAIKLDLAAASLRAPRVGCPLDVAEQLERAVDALEETRWSTWSDKSRRKHHRLPEPVADTRPEPAVLMAALDVQPNARWDNEGAVRVAIPELQLHNLQGTVFYLGARFRSLEGDWSEWVTTQTWSVPNQAFVWKNAFNHYFRYSTLAEEDFSAGRFIAHLAVFTADGRTLAFREVPFRVRLPQVPSMPVPPMPVPVARECGTGADPGCATPRHGLYPMDATVFRGVLQALRVSNNELVRLDTLRSVLAQQVLTAEQLRQVMASFDNELLRLDAVRVAAPRVVNPDQAFGFAATFRNGLSGAEYTKLIAREVQGATPQQPSQPVYLPAPPQPVRDCGTGPDDPGCGQAKDGRWPIDAATYGGVLASLRASSNELVRAESCETMLRSQVITARHLEAILALFNNELTRLDVARALASRVVNPQHALGLAATFRNTFNAQEFTELMAAQTR